MLIDLHVHSRVSPCSVLSLDEILLQARAAGLGGVCVTDHDTIAARSQGPEGILDDGFLLLYGIEYATAQGDFLIFGPGRDLEEGLEAEGLLGLAEERGWAAVAAHPFRPGRGVDELLVKKGLVSLMEAANGRNPAGANERTSAWRARYGLVETGGSDAHTPEEVGRMATRFTAPVRCLDDLVHGLRQGLCRPAVGPFDSLLATG